MIESLLTIVAGACLVALTTVVLVLLVSVSALVLFAVVTAIIEGVKECL